jgi:hypothetical protein
MFVGTAFSPRHQHSILTERRRLLLPLPNRLVVFDKASPRFCSRPAAVRNFDYFERVRQALTNQIHPVTAMYTPAGGCPFSVYFDVAAGHGSRRQNSGFEEAAIEKPTVNS